MAYNKVTYNGTVLIDLSADNVSADKVLSGTSFHGNDGESASGSMVNRGAVSGTIGTKDAVYTIAEGYHSGSGSVAISSVEKQKIIPANIAEGITILGVTGTHRGQTVTTEEVPNASGTGYVITVS